MKILGLLAIKCQTLKRAKPYSPVSNKSNLCLWQKCIFIICKPELATLNKRNEFVSSCRHAKKLTFKGHALETDTFLF